MVKRLQRLRKFSSAKDEPTWQQPDRLDCVEHGGCTPLEIDGITAQFCAFEWLDERNRLVDFSFEIQVRRPSDSEWCVAYRADAKHGVVHEHKFWPDGRKKRKELSFVSYRHCTSRAHFRQARHKKLATRRAVLWQMA